MSLEAHTAAAWRRRRDDRSDLVPAPLMAAILVLVAFAAATFAVASLVAAAPPHRGGPRSGGSRGSVPCCGGRAGGLFDLSSKVKLL